MAATSSTAIRAVIIDGPKTGQIITLGSLDSDPTAEAPSAGDLVDRIEGRITNINLKAQAMLAELRQINANLKEVGS